MHSTVFERNGTSAAIIDDSLKATRHSVFWLDEVTPGGYDVLDSDIRADLVIIGGGYTGLWSAVIAKERNPGMDVVLLEAGGIGQAASGRNGGFCEASLTHGYDNGFSRWPDEMPTIEEMGAENIEGIAETVRRYEMDVELERTGLLKVAVEPHQVDWLKKRPTQDGDVFFDAGSVHSEVNSPTYRAAVWDKRANVLVHPAKLASELARVAAELGVRIFEDTAVRDLETGNSGVTVHADRATVHARQAILATNVFPSLLKRNRNMVVPVYDYVLATEPLTQSQLAEIGWNNRQGISDMANQFHYYRLTADNRIVFGGYDAVYFAGGKVRRKYENRAESHRKLASHFFTTFPQLAGLKFTHRWAGAVDSSTRFCAFFGLARQGKVAYAQGFTGLGVAATRFAANVMLDQLTGTETERTRLQMVRQRPVPFPPEPAASIGINATRWSMDRADHNEGRRNLLLKSLDALGMGFDS